MLFEILFFCSFTTFFVRVDTILINCAIEGNGNANLFLASRDVRVCSSKSYNKKLICYLHHERYFEVINSS